MYGGSDGAWMFIFICAITGFIGMLVGGVWFIVEAIIHLTWR